MLAEKYNRIGTIDEYRQKISTLTKDIYDLKRDLSHRNSDIVEVSNHTKYLTEELQKKNKEVGNFQDLVNELERKFENLSHRNQESEKLTDKLKNQAAIASERDSKWRNLVQKMTSDITNKNFEVERFRGEKAELNKKIHELYQEYRRLQECSHQQKRDIDTLNAKISQMQRDKTLSVALNPLTQLPQMRNVSTESTISEEEYQSVSNQDDYIYVEAYSRKDGTPVKGHYKRKPRR
ncbi:MAG: hypothetical protein WA885_21800 [Phormidesmis sp.]